ncbi:hypothetical protein BN871_DT_00150 [Paenibacillus sp. P22]|nr:hypothetical protein BN871_DT_00150 [Paenibacillus sp. P22]
MSVSTERQSAPALSYDRASFSGWKSGRISPLDGDAFFTSAISPTERFRPAVTAWMNPLAGSIREISFSASPSLNREASSATSSFLVWTILSRNMAVFSRLADQLLQLRCGGSSVDDAARKLHAFLQRLCLVSDIDASPGVQKNDIPVCACLLAIEDRADDLRVVRRAAPGYRLQRPAAQPQRFRRQIVGPDCSVLSQFRHLSRGGDADLIQSVVAGDDHRPLQAESAEDAGDGFRAGAVVQPEQLAVGSCRVGERSKHVEDRAHAELAARNRRMPQRGMIELREHEADADLLEAFGRLHRRQADVDSERLQHIRTAGLARHRAVAMLGDPYSGSRRDDGRGCGDIEFMDARAACAASIEQAVAGRADTVGVAAHDLGESADFVHGLSFHAEGGDDGADLGGGRLSLHDETHDASGFLAAQAAAADQAPKSFGGRHSLHGFHHVRASFIVSA